MRSLKFEMKCPTVEIPMWATQSSWVNQNKTYQTLSIQNLICSLCQFQDVVLLTKLIAFGHLFVVDVINISA